MKKALLAALSLLFITPIFAQELKKSVTWEKIRKHPAPLEVIGEIETVQSSLDRPSFWSVGCETLDRGFAEFDNFVQYMGETGVGYARLQSGWAKCEPKKKGKYDFAWLDHQVDGLISQGIHPWMCLCYGNPLYTDGGADLNARLFGDGPIMDGWLKYVKKIVTRYKGKVTMYEVWNEPDGARDANGKWVAGKNWEEYALLFVRTARAIREVDPDAKIAAFGAFSINKEYFAEGLKAIDRLGGKDLVDYVTYHAYWDTPERIIPHIKKLKADIEAFNPKTRLLQGESGCPAQLEYGHAMCNWEWTEYKQVKWDMRHMLVNFSLGVPSSTFTMVDLNYGWMLQSFGLIRMNGKSVPQYKRPKFYGIQHITSVIDGNCIAAPDAWRFGGASLNRDIFQAGVSKGGKVVGCLLWFSGNVPTDSLERLLVDITLYGPNLEDPVYVDLITGMVHEIYVENRADGIRLPDIPLWDGPVVVMNRSEVNFK